MQSIHHEEIRLADCVVKLDADGARSYTRQRAENFVCVGAFVWDDQTPAQVMRRAIDAFGTDATIDVILANQLSNAEATEKTFGSGWKIACDADQITIFINDLFAQTAIVLKIDATIVNETADVLAKLGLPFGRLFFACPGRDFRYSVFCPLGKTKTVAEILADVQVSFSVALPVFQNDEGEAVAVPAPKLPVGDFDLTLCVLLDEKQETAMAAAAFLEQQAALHGPVTEIGLWRKKFKSAFQHFSDVTDVFELVRLPIDAAVRADLARYVEKLGAGPVITLGQELIVVNLVDDLYQLMAQQFDRVRLVVVGHRDAALITHWAALSGFIHLAAQTIVILGGEPTPAPKSLLRKETQIRRFYLPPYLKQQILAAHHNDTWPSRRAALARQILPE